MPSAKEKLVLSPVYYAEDEVTILLTTLPNFEVEMDHVEWMDDISRTGC